MKIEASKINFIRCFVDGTSSREYAFELNFLKFIKLSEKALKLHFEKNLDSYDRLKLFCSTTFSSNGLIIMLSNEGSEKEVDSIQAKYKSITMKDDDLILEFSI